ncbi:phospholipase A [Colwellia echini]|uniref:Phospholipase A1 n=1 Tax=Colwellia echini TaxID=1982103 RepID=A0ABY3MX00_9GAMM|nr:phospholipase A [Colwellia echini]TYK65728.1 phospholipase A [Colwellia echini]
MKNMIQISLAVIISSVSFVTFSQSTQVVDESPVIETEANAIEKTKSILDDKVKSTKESNINPFTISQYKRNYILPITYITNPNPETGDNIEAKYQISIKLPFYLEQDKSSGLFVGFTTKSYWQLYSSSLSKPFRATDYEPEIFYSWANELSILGFKFNGIQLGFNHQSNGQSNEFSRSWNRLFASVLFSDDTSLYYIKAWYRIPEGEKETTLSVDGDDNPDITDFLGNMELGYGTKWGDFELVGKLRNNLKLDDNKGSIELNISYPITDNYDILLQYFNGYGDSLIDYNRHQSRIGLGMQLKFF